MSQDPIILQFASDLTNRNPALKAIGDEIEAAFNEVKAGYGTRIAQEAQAQFPATPVSFGIDINEYAPQHTGVAMHTMVWGEMRGPPVSEEDPGPTYGYALDFLLDPTHLSLTTEEIEAVLVNRWKDRPELQRQLDDWHKERNGNSQDESWSKECETANVTLKDPVFPRHLFAGMSEEEEEEVGTAGDRPKRRKRAWLDAKKAQRRKKGRRRRRDADDTQPNREDEDNGS